MSRETQKKRVLIVDDEPAILRILDIKLRVCGYEVIAAVNGEQALEMIVSDEPDIILLDIIMPGVDGFQVLKKLRTSSPLPVIACSARPENARKALQLGANYFLAKPFDIDDLVGKIQQALIQSA